MKYFRFVKFTAPSSQALGNENVSYFGFKWPLNLFGISTRQNTSIFQMFDISKVETDTTPYFKLTQKR